MRLKRRVIDEATDPRLLPEMLIKTLNNLDGDALVLSPGEQPIFASSGIER
jgi:two-component system sensor histidine kinase SenX3